MAQNNFPSEDAEQKVFFEWCAYHEHTYPGISRAFHIPNGGRRDPAEAANLKRLGVKAGVPDIFVPVACGKWHGMFIEMKRRKNGRLSEAQADWIQFLNGMGFYAVVACGAAEAVEFVRKYYRQEI